MENFGISIDYKAKKISWDGQRFKDAVLGSKGEFIVHLGEDLAAILASGDDEATQVFLPENFEDHVFDQVPISELMGTVDEETFMIKNEPSASPTDTVSSEATPSGECMPYHPLEGAESPEGDRRAEEQDDGALESLPYGKLNKLYYSTKTFVKRVDDDIHNGPEGLRTPAALCPLGGLRR